MVQWIVVSCSGAVWVLSMISSKHLLFRSPCAALQCSNYHFFVPILSSPLLSYPLLSYPLLSYPLLSYPILSYPILSYPILSYPFLSSHILSYHLLSSALIFPSLPSFMNPNPSTTAATSSSTTATDASPACLVAVRQDEGAGQSRHPRGHGAADHIHRKGWHHHHAQQVRSDQMRQLECKVKG
jgi:hypothetical protein